MTIIRKLLAAGCTAAVFAVATPATAADQLQCAYPFWPGFAPVHLAQELGYFAYSLTEKGRDPDPSLRRCQQLGEAAENDPACLATWAENRDRFLGRTPVPAAPHQNGGQ